MVQIVLFVLLATGWMLFGMIKPEKALFFLGEKRTRLLVFVVWMGALFVAGGALYETEPFNGSEQAEKTSAVEKTKAAPEEKPKPKAKPEPKVTYANYQRVKNGMSYAEVTAILGEPDQEMARNKIAGHTNAMYMWKGSFGANMNPMFQNGEMIQKAQFGLE